MKIKAQIAMVMNLDKCLGCHTCSIPCKQVWTNRRGAEYMWFNNVETKPGIGYPRKWENQDIHHGGWQEKNSKLLLRAGGRIKKFAGIFHNPDLPRIEDYYEPWTYEYERLIECSPGRRQPTARPKSTITGENIDISWGPNWEDDLAGVNETGVEDSNFSGLEKETYLRFRDVFMFHIPRICEHCLNPACVASCPSGALYKRDEDGIVLVDQERCRGWRYCVSGCPYKKVYFNWTQGRSEKCLFCYPRIESGLPTLCAHSCVGRIRYIGVILYDADRTCSAASVPDDRKVYKSHLDIFLNPHDIEVIREAQAQGISETMLQAAKRSPIYKLAVEWRLAFPPHPEFRTLPMVWYIPPLSPLIPGIEESQSPLDKSDFMRIPFQYLANLLSAGDQKPVRFALKRLMAVRKFMRSIRVEHDPDMRVLEEAEISEDMVHEMYNLIAIAKHGDRFVIPTTKRADTENMYDGRGVLGFPPGSQPEVS